MWYHVIFTEIVWKYLHILGLFQPLFNDQQTPNADSPGLQDFTDCQGAAVDIGGYYRVDVEKTTKAPVGALEHFDTHFTYWCLVGNGWEWGNGMIVDSYWLRSNLVGGLEH